MGICQRYEYFERRIATRSRAMTLPYKDRANGRYVIYLVRDICNGGVCSLSVRERGKIDRRCTNHVEAWHFHLVLPRTGAASFSTTSSYSETMPPRIQFPRLRRSICVQLRPPIQPSRSVPICIRLQQRRTITADEKPLPEAENTTGPNQNQLPHVSEEASIEGDITGRGGPDLDQGTPVQEVIVAYGPSLTAY